MNPKVLTSERDRLEVAQALSAFYAERPLGYLLGTNQTRYDNYASLVVRHTRPEGRVLDLGSGSWRLPYTLSEHGLEVDGCDVWSEACFDGQVRQMPVDGARLVRYDGRSLPYPAESFDTVCSLTVFEHLLDVPAMLQEIHRVLRVGGRNIILTPNLAGPNGPIRALQARFARNNDRLWRYETVSDALVGLLRSLYWPLKVQFSHGAPFLYIFPRMKGGRVDFERSDDDAVHLSCPVSYRKWFAQHGYLLLKYNSGEGHSRFARLFNSVFPSWATTVVIVAEKGRSVA